MDTGSCSWPSWGARARLSRFESIRLTDGAPVLNIEIEPYNMTGLDVQTARRLLLMVAGVYILLTGGIELSKLAGAMDPVTAVELTRKLTTLASLTVGTVIGFYLASGQRQS